MMKRKLVILSVATLALALVLSLAVLSVLFLSQSTQATVPKTLNTAIASSGMTMLEDVLYITDSYHRAIWTAVDGEFSLLAGRTQVTDLFGQPVAGYNDGIFDEAAFSEPWGIVPYGDGFLVSDAGSHVLRYLDTNQKCVYTAVGTGEAGFCNDTGEKAAFDTPTGLAVDDEGTVYIADSGNDV